MINHGARCCPQITPPAQSLSHALQTLAFACTPAHTFWGLVATLGARRKARWPLRRSWEGAPANPAASGHRWRPASSQAAAPACIALPQAELSYAPEEQKAWLKDASNAVKRHGFYLRKAIVSSGPCSWPDRRLTTQAKQQSQMQMQT